MTTPEQRAKGAERAARLKAKRKEAGLVRVEVWVHPDNAKRIKAYADEIEAKREKVAS